MTKAISVQLKEANETLKKMEADCAHAAATIKENETKLLEFADALKAAQVEKESVQQDCAKEIDAHKATQALLEAATQEIEVLKANAKTATQIAGEVLGTVAAAPVEQIAAIAPTSEELWAQYRALSDPKAKNDFYNKHRDILTPKNAQAR